MLLLYIILYKIKKTFYKAKNWGVKRFPCSRSFSWQSLLQPEAVPGPTPPGALHHKAPELAGGALKITSRFSSYQYGCSSQGILTSRQTESHWLTQHSGFTDRETEAGRAQRTCSGHTGFLMELRLICSRFFPGCQCFPHTICPFKGRQCGLPQLKILGTQKCCQVSKPCHRR